jgi:heme/copper-type cytochrome/quinol oxidase subunit 3
MEGLWWEIRTLVFLATETTANGLVVGGIIHIPFEHDMMVTRVHMITNIVDLMVILNYAVLGLSFIFFILSFVQTKKDAPKHKIKFLITSYILIFLFVLTKLITYSPCISMQDLPANFSDR